VLAIKERFLVVSHNDPRHFRGDVDQWDQEFELQEQVPLLVQPIPRF